MLAADRQLFYYGFNVYEHNLSLPFGIKPEYRRYGVKQRFALQEREGMNHFVTPENKYWENNIRAKPGIEVDTVLSYGFNENLLVALIKATDKKLYYVICKDTFAVEVQLYDKDLSEKFKELKWIDVTNNSIIELIQNERGYYSLFIFISFFLLIINISVLCILCVLWNRERKYTASNAEKTI